MTHFDNSTINQRIEKIDKLILDVNFYSNQREAKKLIDERNSLVENKEKFNDCLKRVNELSDFASTIDLNDSDILALLEEEACKLFKDIQNLRIEVLFSGEYDHLNCILEIHPGAGGTEACDWANMLLRMYERFCEREKLKFTIIDFLPGEEVGVKSVTMLIEGKNAYGLLESEKGVHRLVRISPFDSNKRRHTSFASVSVTPQFDDSINIQINPDDLKIDLYRSGGAGGQNVNKVSTAVRITHLPTGIVVSSQVERTQLRNKELAMNMLKSKLFEREELMKKQKLKNIIGEQKNIERGSQIRSYVFCPYTLVKDNRTNYEETQVDKVMDGEIEGFIYSYLELRKKNESKN